MADPVCRFTAAASTFVFRCAQDKLSLRWWDTLSAVPPCQQFHPLIFFTLSPCHFFHLVKTTIYTQSWATHTEPFEPKTMNTINRRGFMIGCTAGIAAMGQAKLNYAAFGSQEQEPNQDILLVVFLRGGCDGLSIVPVIDGPDREHLEKNRTYTAVPTEGENRAIPLLDQFGLHPAMQPLVEHFQDSELAVVHAAGLPHDTRSHFDAMRYMELGTLQQSTGEIQSASNGWLTRHLESINQAAMAAGEVDSTVMDALSVGSLQPTSLLGSQKFIGMRSARGFRFNNQGSDTNWQRQTLREMYAGNSWMHESGRQTLDAIDILEYGVPNEYVPSAGAVYPNGGFGENLKTVAQIIKMQLGLRVAAVDLGGWDTHESQGDMGGGYFSGRVGELAQGLSAFFNDVSGAGSNRNINRVTMAVMSEFGRSLKENGSRGTDHGHGNVMLVLGKRVNGGRIYGEWPGLAVEQLYDRRDLAITTDYRQVISEILTQRMGNTDIGSVFPGFQMGESMGIVG